MSKKARVRLRELATATKGSLTMNAFTHFILHLFDTALFRLVQKKRSSQAQSGKTFSQLGNLSFAQPCMFDCSSNLFHWRSRRCDAISYQTPLRPFYPARCIPRSPSGTPASVARWQNLIPSFPCARVEGVGAQSKEWKGSNFAG